MPEVVLKFETRRALKVAVALREIEWALEMVVEGHLPEAERSRERMGRRQEQLLWLARALEGAVKAAAPAPVPHERPTVRNSKTVWCENASRCAGSVPLAEARAGSRLCAMCREAKREQ